MLLQVPRLSLLLKSCNETHSLQKLLLTVGFSINKKLFRLTCFFGVG